MLRGKQVALLVKDNNGSKSASEVDQSRDIMLIIFWQVSQLQCLAKGSSQ